MISWPRWETLCCKNLVDCRCRWCFSRSFSSIIEGISVSELKVQQFWLLIGSSRCSNEIFANFEFRQFFSPFARLRWPMSEVNFNCFCLSGTFVVFNLLLERLVEFFVTLNYRCKRCSIMTELRWVLNVQRVNWDQLWKQFENFMCVVLLTNKSITYKAEHFQLLESLYRVSQFI